MKKPHTPTPKLISKRLFARRQAELQEKHQWLLKDKPLDILPGWLHILDTALLKIKSILTADDIEQSRLEFLCSTTQKSLRIFVDGEKLSPARFKAVENLIDEASHASEVVCNKCGCKNSKNGYPRYTSTCEEHSDFEGVFIEDHRRFIALKNAEAEAEAKLQREKEEAIARIVNGDDDSSVEVIEEKLTEFPVATSLPILRIYDVEDVQKIKDSLKTRSADSDSRARMKSICDEMIKRGGERPYCPLPDPVVFDDLARRFPNLEETIEVVRTSVALAKLGDGRLEIPPLLLVGPAGIGKTQVADEIAAIFETKYIEIHMESEQSGASITGSSEFWGNTQTGLIFDALAKGKTANPMVLLDELDKSGGDSRYDPAGGLYSLLERETAKRFEDLSIRGLPVDASAIIWVITANDLTRIPTPIVSRSMVQHIRLPTWEESIRIAQNIYTALRNSRSWGGHFSPELLSSVTERLAVHEPRKMKNLLIHAFGRAAITGRDNISPDDLPMVQSQRHFGFLSGLAQKGICSKVDKDENRNDQL